jgi:hypothetical protein
MGFLSDAQAKSEFALQSFTNRKSSSPLSSRHPLSRFITFSSFLDLHINLILGLPLRDRKVLPPSFASSTELSLVA